MNMEDHSPVNEKDKMKTTHDEKVFPCIIIKSHNPKIKGRNNPVKKVKIIT